MQQGQSLFGMMTKFQKWMVVMAAYLGKYLMPLNCRSLKGYKGTMLRIVTKFLKKDNTPACPVSYIRNFYFASRQCLMSGGRDMKMTKIWPRRSQSSQWGDTRTRNCSNAVRSACRAKSRHFMCLLANVMNQRNRRVVHYPSVYKGDVVGPKPSVPFP